MTEGLLPPRMAFRFAVTLPHRRVNLTPTSPWLLEDDCRLPYLEGLDGAYDPFADVRGAWNEDGLAFSLQVRGKRKGLWCRPSRAEESDGLHLWIDARATQNVHRATKFCHRFVFLPAGEGRGAASPTAEQLLINRARENAAPVRPGVLKAWAETRADGYRLSAWIPAAAITGFNPEESPKLGLNYAVIDRELGMQTFSVGAGFPFDEDPSLWTIAELGGA